jgi:hypothetical protein
MSPVTSGARSSGDINTGQVPLDPKRPRWRLRHMVAIAGGTQKDHGAGPASCVYCSIRSVQCSLAQHIKCSRRCNHQNTPGA